MKHFILTLSLIISTLSNAFAQDNTLDKKIETHFKEYKPELFRYGGLVYYGETRTIFDKVQIEKELQLFDEIKNSNFINEPTTYIIALCHNILIHTPDIGKTFLSLLNKPIDNEELLDLLHIEFNFAGEFGEKLALENLKSTNENWQKTWAYHLNKYGIYESSIPEIQKMIKQTSDNEIKQYLIKSLMYIGSPNSVEFVKQIIETSTDDEVQEAAIFTYVELVGYDGIEYLKTVKTIGEESENEKKSSLDWLQESTNPKNKFGIEVDSDEEFIELFIDIKSPVMIWLNKQSLLKKSKINNPKPLAKDKKDELLELLIDSKGFGLEAVKGTLFLSIEKSDIDKLLLLRQMCFYSPNKYTKGRLHTLGIFIRHLQKQ